MSVVLRAAAGYFILLFAVRLIGRRTVSMMAPFDMIVLFSFAGMLIAAIIGNDHSIVAALSGIFAIGLMHVLVSSLKRHFAWFGRLVDGTPTIVYERGHWHEARMRHLRMLEADIMTAVRQNGLMRLDQVRYAVVERDGRVSIIPDGEAG